MFVREHSGKVSKKFIGNFYFFYFFEKPPWGKSIKYVCMYVCMYVFLRNHLKTVEYALNIIYNYVGV